MPSAPPAAAPAPLPVLNLAPPVPQRSPVPVAAVIAAGVLALLVVLLARRRATDCHRP